MITNILLGLILSLLIVVYIILNLKLKAIEGVLKNLYDYLIEIHKFVKSNNTNVEHLIERFNKRILTSEEQYHNIITLLKSRFKDLDNATDSIYDRLNTIDSDNQNLIIAEHRCTRNEIKKQAKISSKINSKTKTNKSTQK